MTYVKFIGRGVPAGATKIWSRQIADGNHVGGHDFIFDFDASDYEWLVVYDDVPRIEGTTRSYYCEILQCPPENTILITSEPSSVRRYPRAFMDQFNYILSSQEPEFIRHSGHIREQAGLRWYYGLGQSHLVELSAMIGNPPLNKTCDLSTIISSKSQRHTLHERRLKFVKRLSQLLPNLDWFGHGVRLMDDKAIALDPYRYHIVIENHVAPHHWTEKLADAFLGCTLPFYIGAPDIYNYFPEQSLILLSLDDPDRSARIIENAISGQEWEKRLPAIMKARDLVIERYGLFQNIAALISRLSSEPLSTHHLNQRHLIESAYDARKRRPVYSFLERIKNVGRFSRSFNYSS